MKTQIVFALVFMVLSFVCSEKDGGKPANSSQLAYSVLAIMAAIAAATQWIKPF